MYIYIYTQMKTQHKLVWLNFHEGHISCLNLFFTLNGLKWIMSIKKTTTVQLHHNYATSGNTVHFVPFKFKSYTGKVTFPCLSTSVILNMIDSHCQYSLMIAELSWVGDFLLLFFMLVFTRFLCGVSHPLLSSTWTPTEVNFDGSSGSGISSGPSTWRRT